MSKIRSFALGGLDELGKNLFVLEVDRDIFIFDCGLKVLKNLDLGTNTLIPDFNYLVANRQRIKGLFLSKMDQTHGYALPFLLKLIPDLKVYMSKLMSEIIESLQFLKKQQMKDNVFVLNDAPLRFNDNYMYFFHTASNLPGSLGFTLETPDGFVVYMGSFVLNSGININFFTTQLHQILPHRRKPVLLLVSSCASLNNASFTAPKHQVEPWIDRAWERSRRNLIVCCDQNDWYKIFNTIVFLQFKVKANFELVFIDEQWGNKIMKIIKKYNLKFSVQNHVSLIKTSPQKRKLIFITGDEKRLYSRILRFPNIRNPHLRLTAEDMLLILGKNPFSSELAVTKSLDVLWHQNAKIEFASNDKLFFMEAGFYDFSLLVNFLQPRYLFPFNGYHKDLKKIYNLSDQVGIARDCVFLSENGEIITLVKGIKNQDYDALFTESVFADNLSNKNVLTSVIGERKTLGEEGIVFVLLPCRVWNNKLHLKENLSIHSFGFIDDSLKLELILKKLQDYVMVFLKKKIWSFNQEEQFNYLLKKEFAFIIKKIVNKNPFIFPIFTFSEK